MITPPTAPSPGKPVSAGFFSRLIAWVKSGQLVEGPGYRLKRGPNGTSLVLNDQKKSRVSVENLPGRFAVSITADDEPHETDFGVEETYTAVFENPYYDIGGITYEMPKDSTVTPPVVRALGVKAGDIIALRVRASGNDDEPTAEFVNCGSFGILHAYQLDRNFYTIPLYKIGAGGTVTCDFRTGPAYDMGELPQ